MTDTGRVVPAIESDRTGRPWVEFWGDWLHRVDVPEGLLVLPFGYVSDVDDVHYFYFGGKLLLIPGVLLTGLIVILAWRFLPLVFGGRGSSSSSLLCDPFSLWSTFSLLACLKTQHSLLV